MTTELPKSALTRQRILDAAAKAFRRKGFVATRLTEIAEIAGLRAGSIYYHFASKEQILEEVLDIGIRRISESVQAAVEALPAGTSYRRRVEVAMATHLDALLRHGDYTSANIRIFGQIPDEVRERHLEVRHVYEAFWRRLMRDAQAAGEIRAGVDLRLARLSILGALNWSIEWYRSEGAGIEEIAARFADLAFDGIGASAARGQEKRGGDAGKG
ncbi:MAG: TetR family transcriptional regulator [Alphaproteobacteria bacterium]|jgi:AcrR family transcriptional regulator|nr:TetR family transcriptional regulator [Alphaproteobacteria bacterium]